MFLRRRWFQKFASRVVPVGTAAALVLAAAAAHAQSFSVLHTFTAGNDGAVPLSGLAMDRGGNLYGTTSIAGASRSGTVYKLSYRGSGWILTPLYSFSGGGDGGRPLAKVPIAADGSVYGTAYSGGNSGCAYTGYQYCGVVFRLRPPARFCASVSCPWRETPIYSFTGFADGGNPAAGVTFDAAGNLYGTTLYGGGVCASTGCGVVYKLTPAQGGWTESVLHQFSLFDGAYPYSGMAFDNSGNLFGTTLSGGSGNDGTTYELTPSDQNWTEQVLHSFHTTDDSSAPYGTPILDGAGNVYGTTALGPQFTTGTVFELTRSDGGWTFETIYGLPGIYPSEGPVGGLVMDQSGNLYGTTNNGGAQDLGTVFELTRTGGGWTYIRLHDFTGGTDGQYPFGSPVLDNNGNIYGTASAGGDPGCYGMGAGCGVVWEITL